MIVGCWWIVGIPAQLVAHQSRAIGTIHEQQSVDRITPTLKFSKFPATRKDGITLSLSFQVEKRLAPYFTHLHTHRGRLAQAPFAQEHTGTIRNIYIYLIDFHEAEYGWIRPRNLLNHDILEISWDHRNWPCLPSPWPCIECESLPSKCKAKGTRARGAMNGMRRMRNYMKLCLHRIRPLKKWICPRRFVDAKTLGFGAQQQFHQFLCPTVMQPERKIGGGEQWGLFLEFM